MASALKEAGFDRRGRHWIHEVGEVFIEFPSSGLDIGEDSVVIEVEDQRVLIVGREALIADRLAAWQAWKSPEDGVNAWLVARGRPLDQQKLKSLADAKGVSAAASALEEFLERCLSRDPTEEELVAWAEIVPEG